MILKLVLFIAVLSLPVFTDTSEKDGVDICASLQRQWLKSQEISDYHFSNNRLRFFVSSVKDLAFSN